MAQAQVLQASLLRAHPDAVFYVFLCDDNDNQDASSFCFPIIPIDKLGIPSLHELVIAYNITELNTAMKPYAFLYLFEIHADYSVVYLDPDILVLSPFSELLEVLDNGSVDCVLTPHLLEPAEFAEMDESKMLQYGIYNLGFCALRDTINVRRIVAWWARRLEKQCVIDLPSGLFVDQKWADLLPAFIDKTYILRHPGYNVAYWNLSQRTIRLSDQSSEGAEWLANGMPLRFFHFSGSVIDEPVIFSRHSQQFTLENVGDVRTLFFYYVSEVHRFNRAYFRNIPYAFSWNGIKCINEHTPDVNTGAAHWPVGADKRRSIMAIIASLAFRPDMRMKVVDSYRQFGMLGTFKKIAWYLRKTGHH